MPINGKRICRQSGVCFVVALRNTIAAAVICMSVSIFGTGTRGDNNIITLTEGSLGQASFPGLRFEMLILRVVVRAGWVLGNMIPLWLLLKYTGLLRATADEEALGLDSSHHGGSAYAGGVEDDKSMTNGTHGTNGVSSVSPCAVCHYVSVQEYTVPSGFRSCLCLLHVGPECCATLCGPSAVDPGSNCAFHIMSVCSACCVLILIARRGLAVAVGRPCASQWNETVCSIHSISGHCSVA
jgi:hypothetical protein